MSTEKTLSPRHRRLLFRSWHRGTREADLLLGAFADAHIPAFSDAELDQYETMLECADVDLYNWATERETVPESDRTPVLEMFMAFVVKGRA